MSIFDDSNKVKSNWWEKKIVGDAIEGTFISRRIQLNQLSGKDQEIYEILTADGEVWNVGGNPGIDTQMKHVKLGQIVGFKYVEEKKPVKVGMNGAKIVQVYANKETVDKEWLNSQAKELITQEEDIQSDAAWTTKEKEALENVSFMDITEKPAEAVTSGSTDIKFSIITELATTKLKATSANLKIAVMEATGLAFIDKNLDAIIEKLKAL